MSMQRCGESLPCTCWGGPMNLEIFLNFLASPPASAGHCHALMRRSVNPEGVLCAPGGDLFQLSCFPSPTPSLVGHCLALLQFLHLKVEGILCVSALLYGTGGPFPSTQRRASMPPGAFSQSSCSAFDCFLLHTTGEALPGKNRWVGSDPQVTVAQDSEPPRPAHTQPLKVYEQFTGSLITPLSDAKKFPVLLE